MKPCNYCEPHGIVIRPVSCWVALLALVLCAIPASAQRTSPAGSEEPAAVFNMRVEMPVSVSVPETKIEPVPPTTVWRSLVELEELRLNFHCTNESDTDMWVNRAELRKAIQFRLAREGTPIAVDARWLDEMRGLDRLPLPVPPNGTVLLERGTSVTWTVALRRTDGKPFGPGDHRVTIQLQNVRSAVTEASGGPWKGRVPPDAQRDYIVRVQLPTTAAEAAQRYILEAEDKSARDEFTSALDAYSRAAVADASDPSGIVGMAHMYTALGRFRDAIELYEKARSSGVRTEAIATFLARAYVGARDEANAIASLRLAGFTDAEIPAQMQELREWIRAHGARFDRSPPPGGR
jgi:hypothetical protein